ncbi:MAG TPA: GNAT family N-acetyltransferase [Burkholderiaceae bacterium]|jgi:RimJ/RimL family protein N-acetyltransferase
MKILETARLNLRLFDEADAAFYLRLVNQPGWLRYIGNRGVYTLEQARLAIEQGPQAMYGRFGFCLYLVELKDSASAVGICGLIKRETLDDVDIGFALLDEHCGNGYAFEAASAVLQHGVTKLSLKRIVAITSPDNMQSIRLVEKLGLRFDRQIVFNADGSPTNLYVADFALAS